MSRRSETEKELRNAQEAFNGMIMTQETALSMFQTVNGVAMIELARSMAEAADELHEIRHKLEKLISATERRRE